MLWPSSRLGVWVCCLMQGALAPNILISSHPRLGAQSQGDKASLQQTRGPVVSPPSDHRETREMGSVDQRKADLHLPRWPLVS